MPRSLIASKMRTYFYMTLCAPIFMLLGIAAFVVCLICLAMGMWDERVIRAMLYINGAIALFMMGCALIVYRGTVLTDIARELQANGLEGTATVLGAAYTGRLEVERFKHWYELKLAIQPDNASFAPFTVDIEQLFHQDVTSKLVVGNVVPIKFSPDSDIFALVMIQQAYARLK